MSKRDRSTVTVPTPLSPADHPVATVITALCALVSPVVFAPSWEPCLRLMAVTTVLAVTITITITIVRWTLHGVLPTG